MTFDEVVLAYTAGLDTEIALLQQVEALAAEQRAAWARDELLPLGALATRRAALMHDLTATEARIGPLRDLLGTDPERARGCAGYAAADARVIEAQTLIQRMLQTDRALLTDLESTLERRRREVHDLDTGGATLAAYRRIVIPDVESAGFFDRVG